MLKIKRSAGRRSLHSQGRCCKTTDLQSENWKAAAAGKAELMQFPDAHCRTTKAPYRSVRSPCGSAGGGFALFCLNSGCFYHEATHCNLLRALATGGSDVSFAARWTAGVRCINVEQTSAWCLLLRWAAAGKMLMVNGARNSPTIPM